MLLKFFIYIRCKSTLSSDFEECCPLAGGYLFLPVGSYSGISSVWEAFKYIYILKIIYKTNIVWRRSWYKDNLFTLERIK